MSDISLIGNDKEYVQYWSKILTENDNIQNVDIIAKKIYYYVINKNFDLETDYDDCDDEESEETSEVEQDALIDALVEAKCHPLILEKIKQNFITYAKEIQEVKSKFTNAKFGTELEYGGRGGFFENSPLVQTTKHDGSVSGSGREYNLLPYEMYVLDRQNDFKTNLANFMKINANQKACTEHASAGEHIHYSYDGITSNDGRNIERTIDDIMVITNSSYSLQRPIEEYEALKRKIEKNEKIEPVETKLYGENEINRLIKLYEAYQFLYSTSNRNGTEHYGLGRNVTRGYTCHHTIELRCWRTTLDYRSVIARARVGWEWLKWLLEKEELHYKGYVDWKKECILELLNNDKTRMSYEYLAFNINNKHRVGWSENQLLEILHHPKSFATAMRIRSNMFKKQLLQESDEHKVKMIFNTL